MNRCINSKQVPVKLQQQQQMNRDASPVKSTEMTEQEKPEVRKFNLEWDNVSNASSMVLRESEAFQRLEARVLEWFESKGIKAEQPQELILNEDDRYKRNLSLRSASHVNDKPLLSKRMKMLSSLNINLDFQHLLHGKMSDSC